MKRNLLPMLLGAVAFAVPMAAAGQVPPPTFTWSSPFQPLPIEGGGPKTFANVTGTAPLGYNGQELGKDLPFDVTFFDNTYNKINVGAKGYITFGPNRADGTPTPAVSGNLDAIKVSPTTTSPANLKNTSNPFNVVAAWWGDHYCEPSAEISYQVLDTGEHAAPNRVFIVQWFCTKAVNSTSPVGTLTRFQAQIWLYERSVPGRNNVIRARYGTLTLDTQSVWANVSWGLKKNNAAGTLGPAADGSVDICNPLNAANGLPKCGPEHFPAQTTIQYGLMEGVDFTAAVKPGRIKATGNTIDFSIDTTLRNVGDQTGDAIYDLWLVKAAVGPAGFVPDGPGATKIGSVTRPTTVPGGGSVVLTENLVGVSRTNIANGLYYICADIHPASGTAEVYESNNRVCSTSKVAIGPDLTGKITGFTPTTAGPGQDITVQFELSNIGSADSGPFNYWIVMDTVQGTGIGVARSQSIVHNRIDNGLQAGQTIPMVTLDAKTPWKLLGDKYTFSLHVDSSDPTTLPIVREVEDDADFTNNVVRTTATLTSKRHTGVKVTQTRVTINLPNGCFYGEPIEGSLEVCNTLTGSADAWNFHPALMMGPTDRVAWENDAVAASYPPACNDDDANVEWNHATCADPAAQCIAGRCRVECETNADCGTNLFCGHDWTAEPQLGPKAKTCMNYLPAPPPASQCKVYPVKGRIPLADADNQRYQNGSQLFHWVADSLRTLSQDTPDEFASSRYNCRRPLPDFTVGYMNPPSRVVAGEAAVISRSIKNVGLIEQPALAGVAPPTTVQAKYAYYLGSTKYVSIHDIRLDVQSTGGAGVVSLGRFDENRLTDQVIIPSDTKAGEYFIALIVDPDNEFAELDKSNNVFVHPTQKVVVVESSLKILNGTIPPVTLGESPVYQFDAAGGVVRPLQWSADGTPPGMTLDSNGLLTGTPIDDGDNYFIVSVRSGDLVAKKAVKLTVLKPMGSLQITTRTLPTGIRGKAYGGWIDAAGKSHKGVPLTASGGLPPYTWALASPKDTIPNGMDTSLGLLNCGDECEAKVTGTLQTTGSKTFTVKVTDARGNWVTQELTLMVVEESSLMITVDRFQQGWTARYYEFCLVASGGVGPEYSWRFDPRTYPAGLTVETRGSVRGCLVGTPKECGNFMVDSTVTDDARGQSFNARVPFPVECSGVDLTMPRIPDIKRGQVVEISLYSTNAVDPTFRLVQGTLPPGLSLSDGVISGTVSSDAPFGAYTVMIEIKDVEGRLGLDSLTLTVQIEPKEAHTETKKKSGCSAAGSPANGVAFGLALVGAALLRRRGNGTLGGSDS
ncbi:putative Ig domain-containing protein [Vulgatibacter incomptus]|uniref:EF hand domain/PKD domain protein n=1 Tax=Vulgatibacter incomptus TaxID=1391653 RepID=A0A0K1P8E9_9BACT|nr:putative Ig domain-containing protein [Vulgatibacter incomptus]AKU89772.1 EF hand domain/PKD domain protein [Vulgatibacter incomptus]